MTNKSPYSAPEASLDIEIATETYQPSAFSFSGRIGRLRYLAYLTGLYLVTGIVVFPFMGGMTMAASGQPDISALAMVFMGVAYIAVLVYALTLGKRRLNDVNQSGWWLLMFIVPLANTLLALYLIFAAGTDGVNKYGPAPNQNPLGVKILGLFIPVVALIGIVAAIVIPAINGV